MTKKNNISKFSSCRDLIKRVFDSSNDKLKEP